jgi:hypothetical protein
MTSRAVLLIISLFFSILLSFALYTPWTFLKWLDAVFLVGLFLLVISAVMALIEGRFFEAFVHSTKNFFAKVNKKEQLIRESEQRHGNQPGYVRSFPARKTFFYTGLALSFGSLILSALLYYT